MPPWLLPIVGFLQPILDRVLPDKAQQAQFQQQLALAAIAAQGDQLKADMQVQLGQLQINQAEASSGNWFEANWRPAVGWLCVLALTWQYVIDPMLGWFAVNFHWHIPPKLDVSDILALLPALLGVGVMRSFDKAQGTVK